MLGWVCAVLCPPIDSAGLSEARDVGIFKVGNYRWEPTVMSENETEFTKERWALILKNICGRRILHITDIWPKPVTIWDFVFFDTSVIFICVSGQFVVLKMACILWRCSEWLKSFFGGGRGEALKCENLGGTIGDAVMMKWRQVMCLCKLFTDQRASYSPSPLPSLQVSGECLLAGHHSMSVSPNATNMFHLFWNPSCI